MILQKWCYICAFVYMNACKDSINYENTHNILLFCKKRCAGTYVVIFQKLWNITEIVLAVLGKVLRFLENYEKTLFWSMYCARYGLSDNSSFRSMEVPVHYRYMLCYSCSRVRRQIIGR